MIANLAFSAMCPLGAVLFYTGVTQWAGDSHAVLGAALAFSAGVFICIALGDILPELHFHHHDRLKLSAALLLGLAVAYGVTLLHTHDYGPDEDHHHDHHHHHHSRVIEAAA